MQTVRVVRVVGEWGGCEGGGVGVVSVRVVGEW